MSSCCSAMFPRERPDLDGEVISSTRRYILRECMFCGIIYLVLTCLVGYTVITNYEQMKKCSKQVALAGAIILAKLVFD